MSGLRTNEELKKKIEGITDPVKLAEMAVAEGYDVTPEELIEAEKKLKAEIAKQSDEASDGHEIWCHISYHGYDWFIEQDEWCKAHYFGSRESLERYYDDNSGSRTHTRY